MKRDEHLQPLSRQHHNALMAVLLLKKGVKKQADVTVMKDFILSVWNDELVPHFHAEEEWLQSPAGFPELALLYKRMLKEHESIRQLIREFQRNTFSLETVESFYTILEQHVRFEEREFFPALEQLLPADALQKMGEHLLESNGKSCASFPVKFWE